jgi:signal transduction histidine kinase/putative methionine-R-sulfoxide reductase with GAF domain
MPRATSPEPPPSTTERAGNEPAGPGPVAHSVAARPLGGEALALLAQAVLAVRATGDVVTAASIAADCVAQALDAGEGRLLRVDPRSGVLRLVDAPEVETPYRAEPGGPVEWVLRCEAPWFDEGEQPAARETALWNEPPAALVALPLRVGAALHGLLLVAFARPRRIAPDERVFLHTLADALGLALERAELHQLLDDERRRVTDLERRLSAGEESSASVMSVVAHEIRTPLTAIKAYTEALLDSLSNPHAPRERFLGIISDECDRLARLVGDVLELSRLEASQRPLRLARFELVELLRECLDALDPLARSRGIRLLSEIPAGLAVEADRDLLRQLFLNLVGNAMKFSPEHAEVRIGAEVEGETWTAIVADDGPGIPAEDLPHLFERFFRARQPSGQQVDGTGLGLAISRGIVELHGGRIWAESLAGAGTRLCFTLPLRQMASSSARRIARQLAERAELRPLFQDTVDMVAAAIGAEIVSLMLVDPERGDLFIAASRGLDGEGVTIRRTTVRSGVAGSVAAWGRPVLVEDIETDRRFRRLNHPQYNTKSLLCVPLIVEGEVLGVLNVNNKASREPFDEDDLAVLTALMERVGSAIERAGAQGDSREAVAETCEAIRNVTRLRGEGLLGSGRSVRLARALARALGMPAADVQVIGWVATIRDLGMTPIHRGLRASSGALGADERHALVQHPEVSVEMIRPLEYQASVREVLLSHHERWDGTGYPRALMGEEIPLGARVLALVDAWDSMVSGRSYRAARAPEEALAELRREAGRQFDPQVVETFAGLLQESAEVAT